ncbi:uncharacterized protein EI97DRAFT_375134 [Westerdykella ornata]|uniref:DNA helicase n=1 Tax=Westerdykella ornata TaxID=318751 RepID=A0A6A6JLU8_WESOR|nr:uncharacterized protein EI97DRAFT_375134 [Westerdykella ornata]KAF2277477.1 hypothetical protein EI97DRAFT_375134 [Westerdykella ornata]
MSDSPDELSEPFVTQATLPWNPPASYRVPNVPQSSVTTQPTQILSTPHKPRVRVQVARSSPAAEYYQSSQRSQVPSSERPMNLMAPPGTYTLLPPSIPRPKPVDLTSDPPVEPDSQEEDIGGSNIRPSNFEIRSITRVDETPQRATFGMDMSRYAYDPNSGMHRKRLADDLSSSPQHKKMRPVPRQSGPSRAMPVPDGSTHTIRPDDMRKLNRLQAIYFRHSQQELEDALKANNWDFDAASRQLAQASEDELSQDPLKFLHKRPVGVALPTTSSAYQPKKTAQRGLNAPIQSIQEKFSTVRQSQSQSQPREQIIMSVTPEKPKKGRLIKRPKANVPVDSDEDEGIRIISDDESEADKIEEELDEEGLLKFFNSCSVEAMVDLSNQKEEDIRKLLEHRPFRSLEEIEEIHVGSQETKNGKKARKPRVTFGHRLVESASNMWNGFNAVDQLVNQCKDRGKPIAAAMATWGVDVFGAAKDGELALTSLETLNESASARDSGLETPSGAGTPSSSHVSDQDTDSLRKSTNANNTALLKKPAVMKKEIELKDYQIVGLNWLNLLWENQVSGILADDMGLGKTCQVIAFLSHLWEKKVPGPHLVVVPGSTLENWLREFENFAPELKKHVEPYYGLQAARHEQQAVILENLNDIYVIVTTYDLAFKPADNKFLRQCKPQACIFDEGHVLRNSDTQRYKSLMRIPAKFRLLLTGTPLQNSLRELASILAFIMPDIFSEVKDKLEVVFKHKAKVNEADTHEALLSTQRIDRARSMMTPFVLRRKKAQVLKHLPKKTCRVEYCELTELQSKLYQEQLERQKQVLLERAEGRQPKDHANVMMKLRQAAIHPLLFRHHYTDSVIKKMSRACKKEETFKDSNADIIYEELQLYQDYQCHQLATKYPQALGKFALKNDEWMDSGKVKKLAELLKKYIANGDRTLVFSQFTSVMDILQWVLDTLDISYSRLDGQTPIVERQALLDQFYNDESINVFMLSTKSGGAGINLACANKVIIFDSSFNPQDDIQAENRAHRVGQTREVEVVRLVTKGTVEEQIHALGVSKLELDKMVAGEEGTSDSKKGNGDKISAAEEMGIEAVERMMLEQMRSGSGKGDVKEEFMDGLKAAGLDMSAA